MPSRLLLVDWNGPDLQRMSAALSGPEYILTLARTFTDGVRALSQGPPDLLVTALRLNDFNGLHLILRSRFIDAFVPAVLVGLPADYSSDVAQLGVPFVPKPIEPEVLAAAVANELRDRQPRAVLSQRRWPRKHTHLAAFIADSSVAVVELSYGGLRLAGNAQAALGEPIVVTLPTLGVSVTGVPRWTKRDLDGETSCGVEITDRGMGLATSWRSVVDSVR